MKNLRGQQRKKFKSILEHLETLEREKSEIRKKSENLDFPTQAEER